jgi:hypothetical protein
MRLSASRLPTLHRDLLQDGGTGALAQLVLGHLRQHEAVVVGAEAQERHSLFVDVGDLEAEHPGVEVHHLRQVAAVQADVADLADAYGVLGVVHGAGPGLRGGNFTP